MPPLRLDDRIGSLERGKLADVVVIDGDLEAASAEEMMSLGTWKTFLGGRPVHEMTP
jgi:predicted amidohydrolase YtcJ